MKNFERSFLTLALILMATHYSTGTFIKPSKLLKSFFAAKEVQPSTEQIILEEDVPIYEVPAQEEYQIVKEKPIVEPVVENIIIDKTNNLNSAPVAITQDLPSKSQSVINKVKNKVASAKEDISDKISAITSKFYKSPTVDVNSAIQFPLSAAIAPTAPEQKIYYYPMPYQQWPNYAPPVSSVVQSRWLESGLQYPLRFGNYLNSLAGLSIKNSGQFLPKAPCKHTINKIEPVKYEPYVPYISTEVTKNSGASLPFFNNIWTQYEANDNKPTLNGVYENINLNPQTLEPVTFPEQQKDKDSAIRFRGDIPAVYEATSGTKQSIVVQPLTDSNEEKGPNDAIIPVSEGSEIANSNDGTLVK